MRWIVICICSAVAGILLGFGVLWVQKNFFPPARVIQVDETGEISIMETPE